MNGLAPIDTDILYISSAVAESATPTVSAMRDAVERMFVAKAAGATFLKPKLAVDVVPGKFFQSLVGGSMQPPMALTKWVGVAASNVSIGLPVINALIVLNDLETARPLAIMDGNWITAVRTAAMTAVAAKYLARPDSRSMGFIGCGVQARSHLAALTDVLPQIDRVVAYSRTRSSAESFAKAGAALGLAVTVVDEPRLAVAEMDVVVTGVSSGAEPFVEPSWFKPGAFLGAVDLGSPLMRRDLRQRFQLIATDDHRQSEEIGVTGRLAYPGPFDADLSDLVGGTHPGRRTRDDRTMFLFAGLGLGDLAVAIAVYQAALNRGLGLRLPR